MIEQQGRVTRTEGDRAWIRVGGRSGCPACDAGRGCGAGIFGRLVRRGQLELEVVNSTGARAGEPVVLGVPERVFLSLVLRMYGAPLLAGLVVGLVCHQIAAYYGVGRAWLDVSTLAGFLLGGTAAYRRFTATGDRVSAGQVSLLDAAYDVACPTDEF